MKTKTKNKMIGAGIGLAALAAAATYFLYGKRGTRNRAAVEGWALQLKGEVLEKMENLKDINQEAYNDLVEETAERYGRTKKVGAAELRHMVADLKNAWTHIGKQLTA
jgi:gas vesicle protein